MGLLADEHRRRVVAAVVLGARDFDAIVARSGLDAAAAGRALARLVDAGLIERSDDGLALQTGAFAAAARAARTEAPRVAPEHPDPEVAKVLRAFFSVGGRLIEIPSARRKRLVVLGHLAQGFEPGCYYPERAVNEILARSHADVAALRRYLVDEGFLDRAEGTYWRTGGTVDVEVDPVAAPERAARR